MLEYKIKKKKNKTNILPWAGLEPTALSVAVACLSKLFENEYSSDGS